MVRSISERSESLNATGLRQRPQWPILRNAKSPPQNLSTAANDIRSQYVAPRALLHPSAKDLAAVYSTKIWKQLRLQQHPTQPGSHVIAQCERQPHVRRRRRRCQKSTQIWTAMRSSNQKAASTGHLLGIEDQIHHGSMTSRSLSITMLHCQQRRIQYR